jgi:hypothetical protein
VCCGTGGGGINRTSLYRETLVENLTLLGTSWVRPGRELFALCKPVIFRRVLEVCKQL